MKILALLDTDADLEFYSHPERIQALDEPSARRDLARLPPCLDHKRVQVEFMPLNVRVGFAPHIVRELSKRVKAEDIELIHALSPRTMVYAALVRRMTEVPTLASLYRIPESFTYKAVQYLWQRIIRWGIDHIIVPSEVVKKNLWRISYPQERIDVIYPGMDIETPAAMDRTALGLPNGPLAVMVAPIIPEQGHRTVIEAMPQFLQRVPNGHIAMIGSGALAKELHPLTRLMPIHWLGDVENAHDIIANSNAVLVHPRREVLPMAILHAAALAKPVIGTRVGGLSDIIEHGKTGLMVTYDDPRDLAVQLGRVLSQPNFAQTLGNAAQEQARQKFSLDVQRDQLTEMYESTVYSTR